MDFLAGFVLGSNSNYKLGLPFTLQVLIGVAIYRAIEKYLTEWAEFSHPLRWEINSP